MKQKHLGAPLFHVFGPNTGADGAEDLELDVNDHQEPVVQPEPQMREPSEDELRGAAMRMIQENPDQFQGLVQPSEPVERQPLDYDPELIAGHAISQAEQRMLQREELVEAAVGDAQRRFQGKGIPDHVFSDVRRALKNPKLTLEDVQAHLKSGSHLEIVTNAVGRMAMEGNWSPVSASGGEPVGGGGSGMNAAQQAELDRSEQFLGRKLTAEEKREWVVSN